MRFAPGFARLPDSSRPWFLENFLERLDQWVDLGGPPERVGRAATAWIMTRLDDPYFGVRREPGFDNLWFGPIPGTQHGNNLVAACSYWIFERESRLRCDGFASLTLPF